MVWQFQWLYFICNPLILLYPLGKVELALIVDIQSFNTYEFQPIFPRCSLLHLVEQLGPPTNSSRKSNCIISIIVFAVLRILLFLQIHWFLLGWVQQNLLVLDQVLFGSWCPGVSQWVTSVVPAILLGSTTVQQQLQWSRSSIMLTPAVNGYLLGYSFGWSSSTLIPRYNWNNWLHSFIIVVELHQLVSSYYLLHDNKKGSSKK